MRKHPLPEQRVLTVSAVLVVMLSIGLLAQFGRVVQLKLAPPKQLATYTGRHHSRTAFHARRSDIVDRRGRLLASSQLATRLFADPGLIENLPIFCQVVGELVHVAPSTLKATIQKRIDRRYVVLEHELDKSALGQLKDLKLRGLGTQRWVKRLYPHGSRAGQLLGSVGFDATGLEGVEFAFNRDLVGRTGSLTYTRDVRGRPLNLQYESYDPPRDGAAIRLTIDLMIQSIAEEQLAISCKTFDAPYGQLVVMNPRNGHVLAMANYPPFDPKTLAKSTPQQWRNRCITDMFEPGSTFKPFVWAKAVDLKVIQPEQLFDCTDSGIWRSSKGRRIRDVRGHGKLTGQQVLIKSSNIGMAQIGLLLGSDRLHHAVEAFGMGQSTASSLPGESAGMVNPLRQWNHYSLTSIPMGQEIAATPLQLVRAFSGIANDGMMPATVIRIRKSADDLIYQHTLNPATAKQVRQVLRRVVQEGTGRRANSKHYPIFGKTGTAQIANPNGGGYLEDKYISSFIAGSPLEVPRIVVGCFVHRPDKQKGYYGGTVAAPVVRRVIEKTLMYLGYPPQDQHLLASTN